MLKIVSNEVYRLLSRSLVSTFPCELVTCWRTDQDLVSGMPCTTADSIIWLCHTGRDLSGGAICRYGSEAGVEELRESIAGAFYGDTVIKPSEIFVSDGSKCDIGRLQMMFGSQASVALQVWLHMSET